MARRGGGGGAKKSSRRRAESRFWVAEKGGEREDQGKGQEGCSWGAGAVVRNRRRVTTVSHGYKKPQCVVFHQTLRSFTNEIRDEGLKFKRVLQKANHGY